MSFIGFFLTNAQNNKHEIVKTPISELEVISFNFVVDLNIFNALSFLPKDMGTVENTRD